MPMPIQDNLETETNSRLDMDIRITKEVLENERDIGILKGQLEDLKHNLLGIKNSHTQTTTHSLDSMGKEYEDFVVFLFLQELTLYFENIKKPELTI